MQKSESSVLKILRLMSMDDVRQMTASHQVQKAVNLPMAAGAEGFVETPLPHQDKQERPKNNQRKAPYATGDNVLPFARGAPEATPPPVTEGDSSTEVELFLQRDIFRHQDELSHKKEGVKLYKQTTEAHIYRAPKDKGNKLKFAHTNGVLINKKQD